MKNVKSFDQFINESVNEAKEISRFQINTMGKKLLGKIKIGTVLVTDGGDYTITGFGPKSNAFQEYEAEKNDTKQPCKVKLSAMYGVKLEVSDDPRSAVYRKEEHLTSIIFESNNVDEGIIFREETITIKNEINYFIDAYFSNDSGTDEEQLAEEISNDLNLMKGNIECERRYFEVRGETKGGNQLLAYQAGEFDMYGGPYEPKMQKPTVTLNKKNIIPQVMKAFKKYGWDGDMIDISRTDIWGHIIK